MWLFAISALQHHFDLGCKVASGGRAQRVRPLLRKSDILSACIRKIIRTRPARVDFTHALTDSAPRFGARVMSASGDPWRRGASAQIG